MEVQINFQYNGQRFTRDYCYDRFKYVDDEKIISQAFRVYNEDNAKQTLPIAYIIQVWPKQNKAEKAVGKTILEKDKVIDDFFGQWHHQQNSQ